jgi:hypothetical protein
MAQNILSSGSADAEADASAFSAAQNILSSLRDCFSASSGSGESQQMLKQS